ncbi:MAG: TrkA family potassium uptake protein [Opitutaceae bacterium]|jgi:trk system potassium uptake protein TrkA|nr:TrkA family potassium uptake protein [Opitutaceae bacterium]
MKCLIVGLGVFGRNLAIQLAQLGAEVVALDRKEDNISAIKDEVAAAAVIEFSDSSVLGRFPLSEMDAVIIAIGDDFESSMAFTMRARELGARRLVCRVLSPMHARLLRLLKVERLVVPEEFAARGLAHSLLMRGAVDGIDLGSGHALVEAAVPPFLVGASISSRADLFKKHQVRLVTIKRPEKTLLSGLLPADPDSPVAYRTLGLPALDDPFRKDDVLVLFGAEKGLRAFLEAEESSA